jgi:hypothetical protein
MKFSSKRKKRAYPIVVNGGQRWNFRLPPIMDLERFGAGHSRLQTLLKETGYVDQAYRRLHT